MNSRALAAVALASLLLAGCAEDFSTRAGKLDARDFGEANRQTYAAMIIDPDPQYTTPLPASGDHAAAAIDRYRKGTVKEPERASSTNSTGAGSGSGSSR
jgi:type IV pilus biogenesis protein CpaD/CtpE